MAEKLRDKLIGAWTLISYVEKPVDGSAPNHPMGERPMGIIMYTSDGYMSAQLMRPNRRPFASGDWFKATSRNTDGKPRRISPTPDRSMWMRRMRPLLIP